MPRRRSPRALPSRLRALLPGLPRAPKRPKRPSLPRLPPPPRSRPPEGAAPPPPPPPPPARAPPRRAAPPPAAPRPVATGVWVSGTHAGPAGSRTYDVYVPAGLRRRTLAPLVLLLHGCGQTPAEFADATRFPAAA